MEEDTKLPLKRVELSLTKFNEVAIPHHLDLLRQHKANIIKYTSSGSWQRVRMEQAAAKRAAARLRTLLGELEELRRRVRPADLVLFDKHTQRSRDLTLRAICDYLGVIESGCRELLRPLPPARRPAESAPMDMVGARGGEAGRGAAGSVVSTESVGLVGEGDGDGEEEGGEGNEPRVRPLHDPRLQLHVDDREVELRSREASLRAWAELQAEVRALHDAWQHVQAAALAHQPQVEAVASSTEMAAENVTVARGHLSFAERLRAGAGVGVAAAVGAAVGGPLGLCVGAKAGAAAALAGSVLGYCGARLLRSRVAPPAVLDKDS